MQKLVNETFQKIWFTPTPSHDKDAMNRKILNITDVVRSIWDCYKNAGAIVRMRNILVFDMVTIWLMSWFNFLPGVGM